MADTKQAEVALSKDAVKELIDLARTPYRDPAEAQRREAMRQRMREGDERRRLRLQEKYDSCTHMREDNTSAIAWMRNSDGIVRGCCQRCNCPFDPAHPAYEHLIRIPTRVAAF